MARPRRAAMVERELQCHAARHALTATRAASDDPLVPSRGRVTVRVAEAQAGYAVQLHGSDPETSAEILARARARALMSGGREVASQHDH